MTRADLREEPLGDLGVDFASFNRAADHPRPATKANMCQTIRQVRFSGLFDTGVPSPAQPLGQGHRGRLGCGQGDAGSGRKSLRYVCVSVAVTCAPDPAAPPPLLPTSPLVATSPRRR